MNYIEKAKEIVGKWGYEEEYWWKPIAEALEEVDRRAREEGRKFELLVLEEHLKKQIYQSSISTDSVYRYIDERIADLNNQ